jgi:hypothetical protein
LPDPLGQLVVSGWFKSLTFHVGLRIASDCHLATVWKELRVTTAPECAVAVTEQPDAISAFNSKRNQFSSQMFLSLANDIQLWSAHIVASGLADAEHINNYMHWLSDCCSHLSVDCFRDYSWDKLSTRGGYWNHDYQMHGSFKSLFLLQCIFFAFSTRGVSPGLRKDHLKTVLMRAIRTLPASAQGYLDHLLSSAHFPSPASLTMFRLYVDVAWMRYMQDYHDVLLQSDCWFFGASDSSPQGGRNWLMHEYTCIPGDKLADVGSIVFAMQRAANGPRTLYIYIYI